MNGRKASRVVPPQQPIYRQFVGAHIVDVANTSYGFPKTHLLEIVQSANDHDHPLGTLETGRAYGRQMIFGLLRARLEGTRRIPLSVGKRLVGFEPFRRMFGAPHGYRSVELCGCSDRAGDSEVHSIGPVETEEKIFLSPAR